MSTPEQPREEPADPRAEAPNADWADRTQVLPPGAFGASARSGQGNAGDETDLSAPAAASYGGSSGGYSGASPGGGWSPSSGSTAYSPGPPQASSSYSPGSDQGAGSYSSAPSSPTAPSAPSGPSAGAGPDSGPTETAAAPRAAYSSSDAEATQLTSPGEYSGESAGRESAGRESAGRDASTRAASEPARPYPAPTEPPAGRQPAYGAPTSSDSGATEVSSGSARTPYPNSESDATVSYPAGLLSGTAADPKPTTAPQPAAAGGPYAQPPYGSAPGYAPAPPAPSGYQQPYAPGPGGPNRPNEGPGPAIETAQPVVVVPGSRAMPALIVGIVGFVLVAAGVFLGARYGYNVTVSQHLTTTNKILAGLGAVAIFVAVVLNGVSFWATLIPGVLLTAAGAWAAVSDTGAENLRKWLKFALPDPDLSAWRLLAWTGGLGILILAASIATAIARGSGRRFGVLTARATTGPRVEGPGGERRHAA